MSVVEDTAKDLGNFAGDAIDSVGDALEDTWDTVSDAADWVIDTAEGVVQNALDDPIRTIAQVAAVASGNAYLLPYISAADVAIAGGDIGDIAKAAAVSYAAGQIAQGIAGETGIMVDDAGIPLLPADVAATGSGVAGSLGSQLAGNVAGGAAGNAFATAVMGGDLDRILKASIAGGVGAGTNTALVDLGVPKDLVPVVGGAVAGGTGALLNGGNVYDSVLRGAAIGGVNSALNVAGRELKNLYEQNKNSLAAYFKNSEEYKTASKTANEFLERTYKPAAEQTEAKYRELVDIRDQFEGERSEYDNLMAQYEENKNLYNQTKDKKYADAANALVDDIEAAAERANKTMARYESLLPQYEELRTKTEGLAAQYNQKYNTAITLDRNAQEALNSYQTTYGQYVGKSIEFNEELADYTKQITDTYVRNTGEMPDQDEITGFITSGKDLDSITQDIMKSDAGITWSDIKGQEDRYQSLFGSGFYDPSDAAEEYRTKMEQAIQRNDGDLAMYYQWKLLNEEANKPNGIYSRTDDGSIVDLVNGIRYEDPGIRTLSSQALEDIDRFQAQYSQTGKGSILLPPVFAGDKPEEGVGSYGQGNLQPKEVVYSEDLEDGTTILKYADGTTERFDASGEIIPEQFTRSAFQRANPLYAESVYGSMYGTDGLPSWLDTWRDIEGGVQSDTGYATTQGLTKTGKDTYTDKTGNEYKLVDINGQKYLQDIDNPTGLYSVSGTGSGTATTGTGTSGTGATGTGTGSGTGGTGTGTGSGTGGVLDAINAADYIAENDVNKDGVVNAADTIAATASLRNLISRGQTQDMLSNTNALLTSPAEIKDLGATVVTGKQAELANLNPFQNQQTAPTTTPTQPSADLFFDESQVVPGENPQPTTAQNQQQGPQNLFFDESQIQTAADGGLIEHNPEFFSEGGLGSLENRYVKGDGDGTSDSIPAMLATGEFVIPADVVSGLGNGDNEAGAQVLDEFMMAIRKHKRSAPPDELPPDSKGPLAYLQEAMTKVRK